MLTAIRKQLYLAAAAIRRQYLRSVWGMDIGKGVLISSKAFLDYTFPEGVHIGDHTIITPGARIFAHDFVGAHHDDTRIGKCCFIGANVVVTAGVSIGDHCVIAAGTVVNGHVPDRCMVAGNPAKIIKTGINTGHHGRMVAWAEGRFDEPPETLHGTSAPKPLNAEQDTNTDARASD